MCVFLLMYVEISQVYLAQDTEFEYTSCFAVVNTVIVKRLFSFSTEKIHARIHRSILRAELKPTD